MSKRLFVRCPGTDDMWCYCGGPSVADAMTGLTNVLEVEIECLLADTDDGQPEIEMEIRDLTDEQVAAIPDM